MPKITFVTPDGERLVFEAAAGQSLMRLAVANNVPGIDAECGGACACATCHVYLPQAAAPGAGAAEEDMLAFVSGREPTSRLSCQIDIADDLDGLVVRIPANQG